MKEYTRSTHAETTDHEKTCHSNLRNNKIQEKSFSHLQEKSMEKNSSKTTILENTKRQSKTAILEKTNS